MIQQIGLFPHQKIVTNVTTVPLLYGESKSAARGSAPTSCSTWSASTRRRTATATRTSSPGGQRQRVGVARALAADPPVLLMDEPFGAVDPVVRARLQDEFLRLQRELGKTVVMVTHDIDEAVRMGDRVAVFATAATWRSTPRRPSCSATRPTSSSADFVGADQGPAPAGGHPDRPRTPRAHRTASAPVTSATPSTSTAPSRRRWP